MHTTILDLQDQWASRRKLVVCTPTTASCCHLCSDGLASIRLFAARSKTSLRSGLPGQHRMRRTCYAPSTRTPSMARTTADLTYYIPGAQLCVRMPPASTVRASPCEAWDSWIFSPRPAQVHTSQRSRPSQHLASLDPAPITGQECSCPRRAAGGVDLLAHHRWPCSTLASQLCPGVPGQAPYLPGSDHCRTIRLRQRDEPDAHVNLNRPTTIKQLQQAETKLQGWAATVHVQHKGLKRTPDELTLTTQSDTYQVYRSQKKQALDPPLR